ncbi:DeoR/GlpR family DNA-binding transcription regulator [Acrocarpospora catenulata]|uniref:DeoR/GlpR family DNA-binding transcription regulator n=1 Tax=Acrocarpospora catenulata TaxID=2836182 RepID=UPI001BDAE5DA|nr:DeoR/GlpR family DNA-binding transcription regulator [Acrocarpospora catenulata]
MDGQSAEPEGGNKQRQRSIAQYVIAHGSVAVATLAKRFGVSAMTIRRDLVELETVGVLRRSHGKATAVSTRLFESSTEYRLDENRMAKLALGRAAAAFIQPGQAVFLDDSTTGIFFANEIKGISPLTVITNFDAVAQVLKHEPGIALNLVGGKYQEWCDAYQDGQTIETIRRMRADVFLMSTAAVIDNACFHQAVETGLIKQAMFESSRQRILYVDHTKFERRALHMMMPLSAFDVVIVDSATPAETVEGIRHLGVEVVVAADVTT